MTIISETFRAINSIQEGSKQIFFEGRNMANIVTIIFLNANFHMRPKIQFISESQSITIIKKYNAEILRTYKKAINGFLKKVQFGWNESDSPDAKVIFNRSGCQTVELYQYIAGDSSKLTITTTGAKDYITGSKKDVDAFMQKIFNEMRFQPKTLRQLSFERSCLAQGFQQMKQIPALIQGLVVFKSQSPLLETTDAFSFEELKFAIILADATLCFVNLLRTKARGRYVTLKNPDFIQPIYMRYPTKEEETKVSQAVMNSQAFWSNCFG